MARNGRADRGRSEKKYVLVEFPYPSGKGLHVGHAFAFTGGDVYARFLRAQGYAVMFPMGWDAFGLPTENAAIRDNEHPHEFTDRNTARFREQMDRLALSFDWDREVNTTDPTFYRWTQWIFVKLFEHGLAYKKEMPINWCPSCKVGLANEEVIDGDCERCGAETTRRRIDQWVVRITDYADRLLAGLESTHFIPKVKADQTNWIGRSEGALIRFPLTNGEDSVEVFTTRPETLWGCTYLVVAPEHPLLKNATDPRVIEYQKRASGKSDRERLHRDREKTGVPTRFAAMHPATGEFLPVWASDFVLPDYGTGAIMAVPAHDQRDHDFAIRYGIDIRPVVVPDTEWDFTVSPYTGHDGVLRDSGPLSGVRAQQAVQAAVAWIQSNGHGKASVSYHLRDWIFSRQHYWGEPIPMVHCERCGWHPVPEEQLPVVLPEVEAYQPTDNGESPLAGLTDWIATECPSCRGPARRETDTMPNWAGSDWYFLRYCDPDNSHVLADPEKLRRWMPVDVYIGGDEHNTLHLLYSRFIYLFLREIGAVPNEIAEPYVKRLSHGVILGPDHHRMSKSRGNVIVPDEYIERYGADVLRCHLMFMGPFDATMAWIDRAVVGVDRFIRRFKSFVANPTHRANVSAPEVISVTAAATTKIGTDLESFKFNTAVATLMESLNKLSDLTQSGYGIAMTELRALCILLAPLAPLTADELWRTLEPRDRNDSVHDARWPVYKRVDVASTVTIAVQVNGKLRGTVQISQGTTRDELVRAAMEAGTVRTYIAGNEPRRTIVVPGRAVNFVM